MSYLHEIETVVRDVVTKLEAHAITPNSEKSDVDQCWAEFSVGGMLLLRKWQDVQSIAETLTKLLIDADRRVVVLSMLYLATLKNQFEDLNHTEDLNHAIERINDIANRSEDKIIGIATGVANAMLGYPPAMKWATEEWKKTQSFSSSVEAFYKNSQYLVVLEIAQGWR